MSVEHPAIQIRFPPPSTIATYHAHTHLVSRG